MKRWRSLPRRASQPRGGRAQGKPHHPEGRMLRWSNYDATEGCMVSYIRLVALPSRPALGIVAAVVAIDSPEVDIGVFGTGT